MSKEKSSFAARFPLYGQVLVAVGLGTAVGLIFRDSPIVGGFGTSDLGRLGMLVIRVLKALAVPLVLFAIVDAFARTKIPGKQGVRLLAICAVNVSVAFGIGLALMNLFRPGDRFRGRLESLAGLAPGANGTRPSASLGLLENLDAHIPESLLAPFVGNAVIGVVLIAVLTGAALRALKDRDPDDSGVAAVEAFVDGVHRILVQMLTWVVHTVPFAVFGVVAHVVGRSGFTVFAALSGFLVVILFGFGLHALVYYPLVAWLAGGKKPRVFLGHGADAIFTGLSTNSSLASVPVTLRCLDRMGVSQASARLSACVGTNLNNDGITLYEAMAALFLAQACGYDLGFGQQMTVVGASLMAAVGVAGIPEAGLIVLPLVLAAAGLPEEVVIGVLPVVMSVDWILGRCRSGVNVMSDMLVAILLDRGVAKP